MNQRHNIMKAIHYYKNKRLKKKDGLIDNNGMNCAFPLEISVYFSLDTSVESHCCS